MPIWNDTKSLRKRKTFFFNLFINQVQLAFFSHSIITNSTGRRWLRPSAVVTVSKTPPYLSYRCTIYKMYWYLLWKCVYERLNVWKAKCPNDSLELHLMLASNMLNEFNSTSQKCINNYGCLQWQRICNYVAHRISLIILLEIPINNYDMTWLNDCNAFINLGRYS